MSYQIFISYRRNGGEALAYLINERLTALGYSVFYDIESLSYGKFNYKLLEVIDECDDIILILPPNALDRCVNKDDWLRLEIEHALKTKKNIIPLMMKQFVWPSEMIPEIQEIRLFNGVEVNFEFFDSVLLRLLNRLSTNLNNNRHTLIEKRLKHILAWGDFDHAVLEKIIKRLELGNEYYIENLVEPLELLSKNMDNIDSVILMITDVTKLSNYEFALKRINKLLVKYVKNGGRLICTHDVIYRRTRNELLQEMYGCKITNFLQTPTVQYIKTDFCLEENAFSELPNSFALNDGEICWGDLAPDVDVFFATEDGIPLVFAREYGKGVCIYLNSGDYKNHPPRSILKPEKYFISLLKTSIHFSYYDKNN
ncbi:MAG: toll/interleukin-1 receptor domain-containing protein [Ruminococcus sp.]